MPQIFSKQAIYMNNGNDFSIFHKNQEKFEIRGPTKTAWSADLAVRGFLILTKNFLLCDFHLFCMYSHLLFTSFSFFYFMIIK